MPSGRRISDPTPALGQEAERQESGHGGHHDRSEAKQARLMDGVTMGSCSCVRSASRATSTIMMPFFFTIPMSR